MTETYELSTEERAYKEQLEARYDGLTIVVAPVFAGMASNTDSIPLAFHAVTATLPDDRRVVFTRRSILDSLRLVEAEATRFNPGEPEIRYDEGVLTGFLPESLRAQGWTCSRAVTIATVPRNLHDVRLAHPDGREVVIHEFDDDIVYALEDAVWCAENDLPGFQIPS
jgi:hypothetical protein